MTDPATTEPTPRTTRKPVFTFLSTALVVLFLAAAGFGFAEATNTGAGISGLFEGMLALMFVAVMMCLTAPPAFLFALIGHWRNERWKKRRILALLLSGAGCVLIIMGYIDKLNRG